MTGCSCFQSHHIDEEINIFLILVSHFLEYVRKLKVGVDTKLLNQYCNSKTIIEI